MKTLSSLVLALSLSLGGLAACVDVDDTETTTSEIGLKPDNTTGNHFYWAAYEKRPYIYMGCPDPGPEPWAERATLFVPRGIQTIELELGTAVALNVRELELPGGLGFRGNSRGATIALPEGAERLAFSFLVNNERCTYTLEAEIVVE